MPPDFDPVVEADRLIRGEDDPVPVLAREPRILDRFGRAVHAAGVVGEDHLVRLVYLVVTSRLLDRPVSLAVKGPSAGGKSYTIDQVLSFFPRSAFHELSAMSERSMAYDTEPLKHRTLVLYEAAGLSSDLASYLVRSLLTEGCIRYGTVDKTKDGMKGRLIEREGPTGLIVTTTADRLHPENETRLLSVVVTDTPDQTRRVLLGLADENAYRVVDTGPWHHLQDWLAAGDNTVTIPYALALAELIPPVAVRLRRDFGAVLYLIRAHALLHRATRPQDPEGRVVATLEDYAVVRELVADLVSDAAEATVPETVRETVHGVEGLTPTHQDGVTVAALAVHLGLDKSAVSRRVQAARRRGYLDNLEDRRGRPARLKAADPMPEEVEILPTVATLEDRCSVAGHFDGVYRDAPISPPGHGPYNPLETAVNTATPPATSGNGRQPLHPPCVECGRPWHQGHEAGCPTRGELRSRA